MRAWRRFPEGPASSPSVVAVHVFLEPVLEVPQLVLHPVHHLHGCVQVATPQAVVDDGPHGVALDLAVLKRTHKLAATVGSRLIDRTSGAFQRTRCHELIDFCLLKIHPD